MAQLILEKLKRAEVQEMIVWSGAAEQVQMITLELGWIQFFLEDALKKNVRDVSHWENEVIDLTYLIEDAIDTALITFSVLRTMMWSKTSHTRGVLAHEMNQILFKTSPTRGVLAREMNQILERIMEISERIRGTGDNLGDGAQQGIGRSFVLNEVDDPVVVGFEVHIDNIIDQLVDNWITRRSVVSILGPGGIGKTALAQKVYNSSVVRRHFQYQIWVEISQDFRLTDLLRQILKHLKKEPADLRRDEKADEYFLRELNKILTFTRYLIVLDGVWTDLVWTQLEGGLPNDKMGSRVLITTRFENVAEKANPESKPYKLNFLTEKQSMELLLRKAISNPVPEWNLGEFSDLTELLFKKCCGLPLALDVLGELLSRELQESDTWRRVLETINWHIDGRKCIDVIGTSYKILPLELKLCFMYLTSFPEDCEIDAKTLLSLWISEGFIPQRKREKPGELIQEEKGRMPERSISLERGKTQEEFIEPEVIAESFLKQLVQRCMVEVVKQYPDGSIQSCWVHPIFLLLGMNDAKDKGFIYYSNNKSIDMYPFGAKRMAFHHSMMNINKPIDLLREGFEKMKSLKHLIFKNSGNLVEIPETIGLLKNLETLDVRGTFVKFLPESLWEITKLISVRSSDWIHLDGPPSSKDLLNLQTLKIVHIHKTWGKKFPNLPAIRKLGLSYFKNPNDPNNVPDWDLVIRFLGKFTSLESLKIQGKDIPAKLIDAKTSITRLWLGGSRSQFDLDKAHIPESLVILTLESLEFKKDPMPDLGKLSNLKTLRLRWLLFTASEGQMNCSDQGFSQLESLELYHITGLREWSVANGGMRNIKYVLIESCKTMKKLPDLPCEPQVKSCPLIEVGEQLLE